MSLDLSTKSENTCHPSREGKHNDVIKSPVVFWVRRMKGQLPRCFFPEVYQEGGVDHGDCKTTLPHLFPHGYVGWGALIVTLKEQSQLPAASREELKEPTGANMALQNAQHACPVMNAIPARSFHTRSLNRPRGIQALERWSSCFLSWASRARRDWWGGYRNRPTAQGWEASSWVVRDVCVAHQKLNEVSIK